MTPTLLETIVRRPLDNPGARPPDATVPCGTCRRCCRRNSIVMLLAHEGDDVASYDHEIVDLPGAGRGPILKRQANGDCIYLGPDGCTIHGRAPVICRAFDCRGAYLEFQMHPRAERRVMIRKGYIDKEILEAGRARLEGCVAAAPDGDEIAKDLGVDKPAPLSIGKKRRR